MIAAVADAGPLIHLHEINQLALLQIFSPLHVPAAVWYETVGQGRLTLDDISQFDHVRHHSLSQPDVDQFIQANRLDGLHAGESQCLFLCQQIHVPTILTDDLAVRDAARQLRMTPVGSLGIAIRSYREGLMTRVEAEHVITQLYDVSSLFVTRTIVELAIEQLQQRLSDH